MTTFKLDEVGLRIDRLQGNFDIMLCPYYGGMHAVRLRTGSMGGSFYSHEIFLAALKLYELIRSSDFSAKGLRVDGRLNVPWERRSWLIDDDGLSWDTLTVMEMAEREDGVMFTRFIAFGAARWFRRMGQSDETGESLRDAMKLWCSWEGASAPFVQGLQGLHRLAQAEAETTRRMFFGLKEQLAEEYVKYFRD